MQAGVDRPAGPTLSPHGSVQPAGGPGSANPSALIIAIVVPASVVLIAAAAGLAVWAWRRRLRGPRSAAQAKEGDAASMAVNCSEPGKASPRSSPGSPRAAPDAALVVPERAHSLGSTLTGGSGGALRSSKRGSTEQGSFSLGFSSIGMSPGSTRTYVSGETSSIGLSRMGGAGQGGGAGAGADGLPLASAASTHMGSSGHGSAGRGSKAGSRDRNNEKSRGRMQAYRSETRADADAGAEAGAEAEGHAAGHAAIVVEGGDYSMRLRLGTDVVLSDAADRVLGHGRCCGRRVRSAARNGR